MEATEVIDVKCQIAGNAGGKAPIRASLRIRTVTFHDEKWKIITLMCSHVAGYKTLFAPSCGSVGDFTDILFFSCVCLMASMARSVNCLGQKNREKLYRSI